ncbi:hypothetical protein BGLA2_1000056 [Burkholderia gladioli]|nr:hypothetical protein BGLA2_1000056 [Burkholderia gladioli]
MGGRMKFTLWFAEPRGSKMAMRRSSSACSSRYIIFSNMLVPGTSNTPPVTTLPTSPSAWQFTTVNVLLQRMSLDLLKGWGIGPRGRIEPVSVLRYPEHCRLYPICCTRFLVSSTVCGMIWPAIQESR